MAKRLILIFLVLITIDGFSININQVSKIKDTNRIDSTTIKMNNNGVLEIGVGIGEKGMEKLKLNFIYKFPINSYLSWGIGTGLHVYINENGMLIPLYANFRGNLIKDKTTPYFSLNAGYNFNAQLQGAGFLVNPTVGVSFKTNNKLKMDLGVGYDMRIESGSTGYSGSDFSGINYSYSSGFKGEICINIGFSF